MYFERIESEGLAQYSYILGDAGEAVVIDARRDCDIYLEEAARRGLRITHILETHRHEDFLVGSRILSGLTGAPVWHADAHLDYRYGQTVDDGQAWQLGEHTLQALATPGHTTGSMSYLLRFGGSEPWMLFTGDTLFAGEVGRVDLMGPGEMERMAGLLHDSIHSRILPLGDGVIVLPAHGPGSACGVNIAARDWTTIGIERRLNPRLRKSDRDTFIRDVAREQERPPYFRRMEKLNLQGPPPAPPDPPPLTAAAVAAEVDKGEALLLDTRNELEFTAAHIPGSLFIWQEGLSKYAGWLVPGDSRIILVTDGEEASGALRQLRRLGFDDVPGWLPGGMMGWHNSGREGVPVATATPQQLCLLVEGDSDVCVLDVRGVEELQQEGWIPGSANIHITLLPERLEEIPACERLFIFCGTGRRSTIAASLLERAGRGTGITVVLGGMAGWKAAACPLEKNRPS